MKTTCLPGVHHWSAWQRDRCMDFNGFFVEGDGGVLIDPLPLDAAGVAFVKERGGASTILVTNADHWRGCAEAKVALGARLLAPALERERLGERGERVDAWVSGTADLPEALRSQVEVFALVGGKSPVELALHVKRAGALYFSDVVRSHASGRLELMKDDKLADKPALLESLRPLLARPFDAVLVGDGDPVLRGGKEALFSMLDSLPGVLFNRMNLDALKFVRSVSHPKAATEAAQLSRAMTCRRLGFHVRRLLPGMTWPAYHYETLEEEIFLVRSGRMKIRTPKGAFELAPGDLIALPTGPDHAHQFRNDGTETCEFLALSNVAPDDVSVYPEGGRISLTARNEMYRIADKRTDYWGDEPSVK